MLEIGSELSLHIMLVLLMSIFLFCIPTFLNDPAFPVNILLKIKYKDMDCLSSPRWRSFAAGWRGDAHAVCLPGLIKHRFENKIFKNGLKDLLF